MRKEMYDVIVIGGGAAGFTAALYAARRGLQTLVLTKDLGGQAATTSEIENYPGTTFSDGPSLMKKFCDQAKQHGAAIEFTEATSIRKNRDNNFSITTPIGKIKTSAVILAFGLTPRDLGVPGEKRLKGKGVSYCITCDGPLAKNKTISVIGGGDDALETALSLRQLAKQVYLIYRKKIFRVDPLLAKRIARSKKIIEHEQTTVQKILGAKTVNGLQIRRAGKTTTLPLDRVFMNLGYTANTTWLKKLVALGKDGQIKTDKHCRTSCPGIFAAGDITNTDYKQIVISAGQGATAALEAYRYLNNRGRIVEPDWGLK